MEMNKDTKLLNSTKNNQINEENISIDAFLTKIVSQYQTLLKDNPKHLGELLSRFAMLLKKKDIREDFVKIWAEHALEFDNSNKVARTLLVSAKWKEKKDLLQSLEFPPLRESDNPSARASTINQYGEISSQFLEHADDDLASLKKERSLIDNEEISLIIKYDRLIEIFETVIEEVSTLLRILQEYENIVGTTFYNRQYFDDIKTSIAGIKKYRLVWEEQFPEEEVVSKNRALSELHSMIGLSEVKTKIQQLYEYLKYIKERKKAGFLTRDEYSLNMVLLGNPGTGKTTLARLLAKIYHELGILPGEEVIETNRSQLVGSFVGQTEENVRMIVEKAVGGVLFIDEAYSLKRDGQSGNDYGQTAIDTLVSLMTSKEFGGKFSVILAGYPEEMRRFLDSNPGLSSRFPASNIIELPDYTTEELIKIGEKIALENDFLITEEGKKELAYLIEQERIDDSFGNARTVQNLIMEAIFRKGNRPLDSNRLLAFSVLDKEDFVKQTSTKPKTSPMERLKQLIGLKEVKEAVETYISFVRMQNYRREQNLPHVPIQLHSIFTGNPGTGKTTVAKIYAELLKECGMLKRGHLVVAGRADLIAGYVGQTAIKTKKKIREALGGVLFIDEAYSLFRGTQNDFGSEAVDTLVEEMTKHGENLVVILAGYPKEMERLLESNPGLKSRFKKFFHFPDYNVEEIIAIMGLFAERYSYQLDEKAIEFLKEELTEHPPKGNGRFAENIIHEAIQQQALRLAKENRMDNMSLITLEDIKTAYHILKKGE